MVRTSTRPTPARPQDGGPRQRLIEHVLAERTTLATRCADRMCSELPSYQSLDPAELRPGVIRNVELLFGALAQDRKLEPAELEQIAEHGRGRAGLGVSIDDILRAWRLDIELLVEAIMGFARAHAIAEPTLLQLVIDVHTVSDSAMVAVARGHREAELERAGRERDRRADLVRGVLYGTLAPADIRLRAQVYGLEVSKTYHSIRARPPEGHTTGELERRLGRTGSPPRGLVTVIDGDLAGFVDQPPPRDLPAFVGLGPPNRLDGLEESFRSATRALATATAFDLPGVHDMTTLGIRPAVIADREVGDALVRRYIEPLSTLSNDMARTLAATVERFLANGQRVDPTAKELVLHPNTLRYRIKRFEDTTRCDLREPGCALEVWWALQRTLLDAQPIGPER